MATPATMSMNANPFAGFTDESNHIYTGTGQRRLNTDGTGRVQSFQKIPVVDFSEARSLSLESRQKLAREIIDVCETVGFFYVKDHGLDQELITKVKQHGMNFFANQSHNEKMELSMDRNAIEYYGYAPMRRNMPDGGIKTRLYETMHWGYEPCLDPRYMAGDRADYNFWPPEERMPGFEGTMKKYYSEVFGLALTIMKLLALGLDLEENFFDQFCEQPQVLLALNHYPTAAAQNPEGSGLYAHADLEVVTILLQDEVKSLQVLNENGDWIPADPIPGTFVINVGDTLSMWTNNRLKSTVHRVDNSKGANRLSIPFFFGADPDAVVAPLPSCISEDNPAKFEPIRIGDFHKREIHKVYPEGKKN